MKNMFETVANFSAKIAGCMFLVLLTVIASVRGLGAQVDQENWDLSPTSIFTVAQQEFTPTVDSLDSVQLFLSDRWAVGFPGGPMSLRIRADGPNGPIIAASQPTYVSPWYEGPVGFGFAEPVSVVPGRVYLLEPFNNIAAAPFGVTPARYSGGQFFGNFQPADYDLIFREGIGLEIVPEPSPAVLCAAGLLTVGVLQLRAARCVTQKTWKF